MNCGNNLCRRSKRVSLSYACEHCKQRKYCSNACRLQDWNNGHSSICKKSEVVASASSFAQQGKFLSEEEANSMIPKIDDVHKYYEPVEKNAKLGKGAYGEVVLMKEKSTGKLVAMKVIEKANITSQKVLASLINEIKIQKRILHDNIIRIFNHLEDSKNIYIVMEYAEKENLFRHIRERKKLSETEAYTLFKQTCSALCFLHAHHLMHRDIKPENLLLTRDNKLKLCDFGFCVQYDSGSRVTCCGTIEYMAPEIFKREKYGEKVDVWSLGVLLYEMLHGYAPFHGRREQDTVAMIMKNQVEFGEIKEDAKELIRMLLRNKPSERPKVQKILDFPWMKRMEAATNRKSTELDLSEKQNKDGITNKVISNPVKLIATAHPHKINTSFNKPKRPTESTTIKKERPYEESKYSKKGNTAFTREEKKAVKKENLFEGTVSKNPVSQPTVAQIISQKPPVKTPKMIEEGFATYRVSSRSSKRNTKVRTTNSFFEPLTPSKFENLDLTDMNFVITNDPLFHVNKYLSKLDANPRLKWQEALMDCKEDVVWIIEEHNKKLMGVESERLNESYSSDDYIFQRSETVLKVVDYLDDLDLYPYAKESKEVEERIKKENERLRKALRGEKKEKKTKDEVKDNSSSADSKEAILKLENDISELNRGKFSAKDSEYQKSIDKMMNLLVGMGRDDKGLYSHYSKKESSYDRTSYFDFDRDSDIISESDYDAELQRKFEIEAKENMKIQRNSSRQGTLKKKEANNGESKVIVIADNNVNLPNKRVSSQSKESSGESKKSDQLKKSKELMGEQENNKGNKSIWNSLISFISDSEL
eukprot:TRINITY_DN7358_c0_g1_i14.p1 TRINITY_DN7358_c0_g1~~TRINITY_DN7358_c0_g1_i14.p1  ORF type:complete len:819 (+),score=264.67 TRINITY_DN7358_c0_g1_i14:151-2607(+)